MLERTTVFVDTSYLLASFYNSWEEGAREQLEVSLSTVVQTLNRIATKQSRQPTHRQFWYDGVPDSGPHRYQRTLRVIDGVILRTGQLIEWGNRRSQKAVDTRLVADMVLAAHRGQCTDMMLVSGDADMIPGVEAAIEAGVRVHLVGFGWDSVSSALRNACDTSLVLDPRTDFADSMQIRVLEGPIPPQVRTPRQGGSGGPGGSGGSGPASGHGTSHAPGSEAHEDGEQDEGVDIGEVDFQPGRARDESVAGAHEKRRARAEAAAQAASEANGDPAAAAPTSAEAPAPTPGGAGGTERPAAAGETTGAADAEASSQPAYDRDRSTPSSGPSDAAEDPRDTDAGTEGADTDSPGSSLAEGADGVAGADPAVIEGEEPHRGAPDGQMQSRSEPSRSEQGPVQGPQVPVARPGAGSDVDPGAADSADAARRRNRSTVTVTHRSVTITARAERESYAERNGGHGDASDVDTTADDEAEDGDGGSPRPNPSMMAARRRPVRSRYVPLTEEVWSSSGEPSPFDVGQQYATWWYRNAADEEQRLRAHTLTGGALPPEIDRPLLQFACQMLHEFTLNEFQRVALRDGFHEGIRGIVMH